MARAPMGPGSERDQARFYAKVALPNEQGCMLWLGKPNKDGYGCFWLGSRMIRAHRFAYVLAYGVIPEGLQVDHVKARGCTNRHCVAPEHLEAVTPLENHRRGDAGSNMRSRTHCPADHPYAGDNLRVRSQGWRECRACSRERTRRYRERLKRADPVS